MSSNWIQHKLLVYFSNAQAACSVITEWISSCHNTCCDIQSIICDVVLNLWLMDKDMFLHSGLSLCIRIIRSSCVVHCCDTRVCCELRDVTGRPGSPAGVSRHRHVAFTYFVFIWLITRLPSSPRQCRCQIVLPVLYDFVPFLFISLLLQPCFGSSWVFAKSSSLKENSLATVTKHAGLRSQAWLAPHMPQWCLVVLCFLVFQNINKRTIAKIGIQNPNTDVTSN